MKRITFKDCEELKKRFDKHLEMAEQHEYFDLLMVDILLKSTINEIKGKQNLDEYQETLNTMFGVVLRMMGSEEEAKEYE